MPPGRLSAAQASPGPCGHWLVRPRGRPPRALRPRKSAAESKGMSMCLSYPFLLLERVHVVGDASPQDLRNTLVVVGLGLNEHLLAAPHDVFHVVSANLILGLHRAF